MSALDASPSGHRRAEMNEILNALAAIAGAGRFNDAKKSLANATPEELIKHVAETLLARESDLSRYFPGETPTSERTSA